MFNWPYFLPYYPSRDSLAIILSECSAESSQQGRERLFISAAGYNGNIIHRRIYGFDKKGNLLDNFPVEVPLKQDSDWGFLFPSLAFPSKDGKQYIGVVADDFNGDVDSKGNYVWDYELSLYVYSFQGEFIRRTCLLDSETSVAYLSPLATGDVDNDGELEAIIGVGLIDRKSYFEKKGDPLAYKTFIYVVDGEGNLVSTPLEIEGYFLENLALANFSGSGLSIVTTGRSALSRSDKIVAYDYDGNLIFSVDFNDKLKTIVGLMVGDVDNDNESEVVIVYDDIRVHESSFGIQIYNKEGTLEREIKVPILGVTDPYYYGWDTLLSDFDGDGELEVIQQLVVLHPDEFREKVFGDGQGLLKGTVKTRVYIINLGTPYNPNKMDWPMFQHDPQHTGCYGCEKIALPPVNNSRPQSKIVNNGDFDVKGILSLRLQKSVMAPDGYERWITHSFCEGEVVIPAHGFIKLDVGEPCAWNLYNVSASEPGRYRVYGKFQVGEEFVDASWEFDVLKSKRKVIKES